MSKPFKRYVSSIKRIAYENHLNILPKALNGY